MKKVITAFASVLALGSLLAPTTAFAAAGSGTASLHLSPASGSYSVGQTFTVTITEASSVSVAAVDAEFTYPSNLLQCNGVSGSTAFANSFHSACSGGTLSLAVGVQGTPVTGSQTVGSASFTVLAAGTASLAAANAAEIDDATVANVCDSTCAAGASAASFSLATASQPTDGGNTNTGGTTGSTQTKTTTSTSTGSTGSTSTDTPAPSTTTGQTKSNTQTNKHYTPPQPHRSFRSHRTSVVTSTISALIVLAAAAYWLMFRKRTEVAPAKVYKLDTSAESKTTGKKATVRSKSAGAAAKKAPAQKTSKASAKKKA